MNTLCDSNQSRLAGSLNLNLNRNLNPFLDGPDSDESKIKIKIKIKIGIKKTPLVLESGIREGALMAARWNTIESTP